MHRSLPLVRGGAWYHVVNQGRNGTRLFPDACEASAFISTLGGVAERRPIEIHAYCAMGTHYHLLVRAEELDLIDAISMLEREIAPYAMVARRRRMAAGRHLLRVTRYIHRNPIEARLVSRAEDWPWSSYRGYLDGFEAPYWLRTDAVLGWLGSIGARERYRGFVEG